MVKLNAGTIRPTGFEDYPSDEPVWLWTYIRSMISGYYIGTRFDFNLLDDVPFLAGLSAYDSYSGLYETFQEKINEQIQNKRIN